MLALEQIQGTMMQALDRGPEFLPDHLFIGSNARVLAGMKVHANTISHARLVALEDTFPRTRAFIGHDQFNEHSRQFLDWPGVTARPLAQIGRDFPHFLASSGENGEAADLAVFEWAWLSTYHAPEAEPLRLADLAGIEETALTEVAIARHPAANMGRNSPVLREQLGSEVPGLDDADSLLLTRPDAEVLASAASAGMWTIFASLDTPDSIGNLLALPSEPDCKDRLSPDDFMQALIALLEAGALKRVA